MTSVRKSALPIRVHSALVLARLRQDALSRQRLDLVEIGAQLATATLLRNVATLI